MAEINLDQFCDPTADRKILHRPFVRDGLRYATNAVICVVTLAEGEPDSDIPGGGKVPVRIAEWMSLAESWAEWPAEKPFVHGVNDEPVYVTNCEQCHGRGSEKCNLGHDHECVKCTGSGFLPIEDGCFSSRQRSQRIGTATVAWKYDQMIRRLPSPEYSVITKYGASVVCFRFDGGHGVLATVGDC